MSAAPEFAQPASLPPTSEDYHALTIRSVQVGHPSARPAAIPAAPVSPRVT